MSDASSSSTCGGGGGGGRTHTSASTCLDLQAPGKSHSANTCLFELHKSRSQTSHQHVHVAHCEAHGTPTTHPCGQAAGSIGQDCNTPMSPSMVTPWSKKERPMFLHPLHAQAHFMQWLEQPDSKSVWRVCISQGCHSHMTLLRYAHPPHTLAARLLTPPPIAMSS